MQFRRIGTALFLLLVYSLSYVHIVLPHEAVEGEDCVLHNPHLADLLHEHHDLWQEEVAGTSLEGYYKAVCDEGFWDFLTCLLLEKHLPEGVCDVEHQWLVRPFGKWGKASAPLFFLPGVHVCQSHLEEFPVSSVISWLESGFFLPASFYFSHRIPRAPPVLIG